jgi:hypothetical protein
MKTTLVTQRLLSSTLFFFCLCALGQTNSETAPVQQLSLPKLELRPADLKLDNTDAELGLPNTNALTEQVIATNSDEIKLSYDARPTTFSSELSIQGSRRELEVIRDLEEGGYLIRRDETFETTIDRYVNNIFEPEVIHLGKMGLSSSIVTAIKRKNPLCLINPIFFNLSW